MQVFPIFFLWEVGNATCINLEYCHSNQIFVSGEPHAIETFINPNEAAFESADSANLGRDAAEEELEEEQQPWQSPGDALRARFQQLALQGKLSCARLS